jgi:hypothetical protein
VIRRPKLLAASAIATLALAGGVPIAAAKAGGHHKSVHRLVVKAAASYLGLSRKELRAQSHGTSLAQLATAQGKSVDGLRQAMYGAVKVKLDQRVAAGKLSAEKEQAKLVRIQAWISKLVAKIRK